MSNTSSNKKSNDPEVDPRDYTNLYQGSRKYKNLRQQVSGGYKQFLDKYTFIRIPLAVILILILLFMTGLASDVFARRDNFETANKIVLFPKWMETYYPEKKAYYEAGCLYQGGRYEEALQAFDEIEGFDKCDRMKSLCNMMLAQELIESGDFDKAYEKLSLIDIGTLNLEDKSQLNALAANALEIIKTSGYENSDKIIDCLKTIVNETSS